MEAHIKQESCPMSYIELCFPSRSSAMGGAEGKVKMAEKKNGDPSSCIRTAFEKLCIQDAV